ncbi:MAG: uroporphyrinogen-III synthase [Pseudomonadota bacterium]
MTQQAVWVTRTEPGATRLTASLHEAGYPVWKAPVLTIEPIPRRAIPQRIDLAIVVSEQAVRHAPERLWSRCERVFAIGPRTAAALALRGVRAFVPKEATSEGLLRGPLAGGSWQGMRVCLVTGVDGRTLLQEELAAAGARVTRLECYRRVPVTDLAELPVNRLTDTQAAEPGKIGAVVCSSGAGLEAVAALMPAALALPVLVPSGRVAEQASALGFTQVLECSGAADDAVLETMDEHPQTRRLRQS